MKKIISMLLVVVLLLGIFVPTVFAVEGELDEYSFFISIYNDMDQTYLVPNTKMTVKGKTTILQLLDLLKSEELIIDYSAKDNKLKWIELEDKTIPATISDSESAVFYMKRNGQKQATDAINGVVENGDIIEWIYGRVESQVYVPENTETSTQIQPRPQTTHWSEDAQKAMIGGCEFLTLNQENSDFYIVSLGCAGKTADVKMVNSLLSDIRQVQSYDTPTAIARNILSLTFCGYDASDLMIKIVDYPDIMKQGVFGAINALIAYDSKKYIVSPSRINSREKLVDILVDSQRETGGFGLNANAKDDLDTTAMAITALSPYMERSDVKAVIDKGIKFLVTNQTPTGGFGFMGKESSESLSQVIIALCSVGIEINDERFMNNNKTLLDHLLEYKNEDGGFSHVKGEASGAMPTEQAIIALSAIKQNDNPYKMTRELSLPPKTKTQAVVEVVKNHPLRTVISMFLVLIIVIVVVSISVAKTKSKGVKS
ncbi:MAG: prenyltransferase/squalene oxidase repeat-containing protein [Oscillospiraceae bacterium]